MLLVNFFFTPLGPPVSAGRSLWFATAPEMPPLHPSWAGQSTRLPQLSFKHNRSPWRRRCSGESGTQLHWCPAGIMSRGGEVSLVARVKWKRDAETKAAACGDSEVCFREYIHYSINGTGMFFVFLRTLRVVPFSNFCEVFIIITVFYYWSYFHFLTGTEDFTSSWESKKSTLVWCSNIWIDI